MRPAIKVGLSTASVYPLRTEAAFEYAARLGYDGVELMVWAESVSQDIEAIAELSRRYVMPVLAVHAPCLLISQRVWGANPIAKLDRSVRAAEDLGAQTVVIHPPFRWQRRYAEGFSEQVARLEASSDVIVAVENMFPLRARGRSVVPYSPGYDPTEEDFLHFTLDLSHTSVAQNDALELAARMGDRLVHVHIADGIGTARDEHLVPGRGSQPCAELLEGLASRGFDGAVVVEINTRRAESRAEREADLAEALAFSRLYLAAPAPR